jgi:hypothetical protein
MTRIKQRTAEYRMTNEERWNRSRSAGACAACREIFFKIDRIHSFDIQYSLFDILFFKVSFSVKLVFSAASSWADT